MFPEQRSLQERAVLSGVSESGRVSWSSGRDRLCSGWIHHTCDYRRHPAAQQWHPLSFLSRWPSRLRTARTRRMSTKRASTLWAASWCVTPEGCWSAQTPTGPADSKTQTFSRDLLCTNSFRIARRAGYWVRRSSAHVQSQSLETEASLGSRWPAISSKEVVDDAGRLSKIPWGVSV